MTGQTISSLHSEYQGYPMRVRKRMLTIPAILTALALLATTASRSGSRRNRVSRHRSRRSGLARRYGAGSSNSLRPTRHCSRHHRRGGTSRSIFRNGFARTTGEITSKCLPRSTPTIRPGASRWPWRISTFGCSSTRTCSPPRHRRQPVAATPGATVGNNVKISGTVEHASQRVGYPD